MSHNVEHKRLPFVCQVDGIECHGTIEQHRVQRALSAVHTATTYDYYVVGIVVDGLRRYSFKLCPLGMQPQHYVIRDIQRMSAVREWVMEAIDSPDQEARFADLAFEVAMCACVNHYHAKPPRYAQPTENVGEMG